MEIAERLAHYINFIAFESIKPEVINEAKRRLIDALGCAFGAWKMES